jgi:WD40 repeat protein
MRFLKGHRGYVQTVAFDRDGTTLATGGEDGTVRLWNAETADQCGQFNHDDGPVSALAFSPSATWLASGGHDRRVHLWHRDTGRERRLKGFRGCEVYALAFAPSGLRLPGDHAESLAWGRADGVVGVWSLEAEEGSEVVRRGGTGVLTLAFAPDGRTLAVAGSSGFLQLWDIESRRLIQSIAHEDGPCCRSLAFSPNGRLLAAALIQGPRVFHLAEGRFLENVPARPRCVASGLAFTPNGRRLLAGGWDGVIGLHDLRGMVVREEPGWNWGMNKVYGVAVSPDGMLAAAVGDGPDPVVLWDLD